MKPLLQIAQVPIKIFIEMNENSNEMKWNYGSHKCKAQKSIHKTKSQYTKLNFDTQNEISIHRTKFRYKKRNLNTQN